MAFGGNLHSIVRDIINCTHSDIAAILYRNTGRGIDANGHGAPIYSAGQPITAQKKFESPATLLHAEPIKQNEESRKFYLFSILEPDKKITGVYRPLARVGDVFQLANDKSWWLIDAIVEDFSNSGWVCVRATTQVNPGIEVDNG